MTLRIQPSTGFPKSSLTFGCNDPLPKKSEGILLPTADEVRSLVPEAFALHTDWLGQVDKLKPGDHILAKLPLPPSQALFPGSDSSEAVLMTRIKSNGDHGLFVDDPFKDHDSPRVLFFEKALGPTPLLHRILRRATELPGGERREVMEEFWRDQVAGAQVEGQAAQSDFRDLLTLNCDLITRRKGLKHPELELALDTKAIARHSWFTQLKGLLGEALKRRIKPSRVKADEGRYHVRGFTTAQDDRPARLIISPDEDIYERPGYRELRPNRLFDRRSPFPQKMTPFAPDSDENDQRPGDYSKLFYAVEPSKLAAISGQDNLFVLRN